ncbi:hypothetical protein Aca07nite_10780 [Actinoplanes capillaceus]|uniref:Uncharacterized protein n=1 Tax=Actinoplanes campanulatus TaxID=113559 RepID=A0ABQ3WFR1_9ACTN|nr:hypothetical protein [Actinoplanes capillaceus]GID43803.1 hypothetical protein Aca07nite_10780 [Actinoplanes capillaceus]
MTGGTGMEMKVKIFEESVIERIMPGGSHGGVDHRVKRAVTCAPELPLRRPNGERSRYGRVPCTQVMQAARRVHLAVGAAQARP